MHSSMIKNRPYEKIIKLGFILVISFLVGLVWFLFLYQRYPLYFSNVNWIYNSGGDLLKAQIGWEWFRQEPWHFPLGRIESYGYPFGTSLSFLDSIPLLAIPLKLISPFLDSRFQYLGLWELLSLIGQMVAGMLIISEFSKSRLIQTLSGSLLVLSPALIFRAFFHSTLSAHWILLFGIWFVILEYKVKLWRWGWLILFGVAMFVHLYFVAMLLPLWFIGLIFRYKRDRHYWQLALDILLMICLILLSSYCLGLFNLGFSNLQGFGFGHYSWNLNGFINPFQYSAIFNPMKTSIDGGQYEGFSYLGLGNMFVFFLGLIFFFQRDYSKKHLLPLLSILIISVLLILFSLSNKAFINDQIIWNFKIKGFILQLFSIFRSSGRFIWPVFYFLILFGMLSTIKNMRIATPILILAIIIQMIDIQPLYSSKHFTKFSTFNAPLQTDFWKAAAVDTKHIVVLPVNDTPASLNPIIIYARQNHMTLNWGYFSRADGPSIEKYAEQAWDDITSGTVDPQTLFLFGDEKSVPYDLSKVSKSMIFCEIDGFKIYFSKESQINQNHSLMSQYCNR